MNDSKQSLKSKIKEKIASIGWHLFLWGNNFTQEQYWEEIYQQEKMFKENRTCKICNKTFSEQGFYSHIGKYHKDYSEV